MLKRNVLFLVLMGIAATSARADIKARCRLLMRTLQNDERITSHQRARADFDQIRNYLHQRHPSESETALFTERYDKHMEQMVAAFNLIHRGADYRAQLDTHGAWPVIVIQPLSSAPTRPFATPFERLLWQHWQSYGKSSVIYDPIHTAYEHYLGMYDFATRTIYLSPLDLLSIDTIPTMFLHESFHRIIEDHSPGSSYVKYQGFISGRPSWASSIYLKDQSVLYLSEIHTLWVALKAHERNLRYLLSVQHSVQPEQLHSEVQDTINTLTHLVRVLSDVQRALKATVSSIKARDLRSYVTTDGPRTYLRTHISEPEFGTTVVEWHFGTLALEKLGVSHPRDGYSQKASRDFVGLLSQRWHGFLNRYQYAKSKLKALREELGENEYQKRLANAAQPPPDQAALIRVAKCLISDH